jgi:hypothetical protein
LGLGGVGLGFWTIGFTRLGAAVITVSLAPEIGAAALVGSVASLIIGGVGSVYYYNE